MGKSTKAGEANHRAAQTRIWDEVQRRQEKQQPRCSCALRRGMDWDSLLELGEGCTHRLGRYICPTLDYYRRAVGGPPRHDEELGL